MSAPAADQGLGQRFLERVGAGVELGAPVEVDDDRVGHPAHRLDGGDQGPDVVGGRQPRSGGRGRPRRLQVGVDDLGGGHDGDPLSVDGGLVGRERLGGVLPDAEHRVVGRGAGAQGLLQSGLAAVQPVVVGLGDQGHAGAAEGVECRGRGEEVVLLRLGVRARAVGHGGLEVDHGQVGARQQRGDGRPEGSGGVGGQPVTQVGPGRKVHVAAEGEGHRPAVPLPLGLEPRIARRDRGDVRAGWSRPASRRAHPARGQHHPEDHQAGQAGGPQPAVPSHPP